MGFNIFNLFKKRKAATPAPLYEPLPDPVLIPNQEIQLEPSHDIETTRLRVIIEAIIQKHKAQGIVVYKPATAHEIAWLEQRIGFSLPIDFKEFYSICNGFGCTEDIFNMTPIQEIDKCEESDGLPGFYFAEYLINSDVWGLHLSTEGKYEIFNTGHPDMPMTSSLEEFLSRFLKGNVFEEGGLYDWQDELGIGK